MTLLSQSRYVKVRLSDHLRDPECDLVLVPSREQEICDLMQQKLKPGSQYIARDASRPEVIIFSMDFDASRRKNRIDFLFLRRDASKPIEKIMTSGRDASRAIYCEPGLNDATWSTTSPQSCCTSPRSLLHLTTILLHLRNLTPTLQNLVVISSN